MARSLYSRLHHLVVILGDRLDPKLAALGSPDLRHDAVWMAKAADASTHVWSHKARIVLLLAAMRHDRDALTERVIIVLYRQLDDPGNLGSLIRDLEAAVRRSEPQGFEVYDAYYSHGHDWYDGSDTNYARVKEYNDTLGVPTRPNGATWGTRAPIRLKSIWNARPTPCH